jgi:HSP20 family protein
MKNSRFLRSGLTDAQPVLSFLPRRNIQGGFLMELVRWEPFDGFDRIQSRINELFDDNFARARSYPRSMAGVWWSAVDILESKDAYLIRAEVPGMKKDDFTLEVHDGTLTLSGERKAEQPADGVEYHRNERVSGKFSRAFHLPQTVDSEGIKATYRDGILEVHVPKAEEAKPRQIAITLN